MQSRRLTVGVLCLGAPMYFATRFLYALLRVHHMGPGWLQETLLATLIETVAFVSSWFILSLIECKIRDYRAKRLTKEA